jgi:hypothetical protein
MLYYSAINVSKTDEPRAEGIFSEQDFIEELPSGVVSNVSGLLRSGFLV